VECKARDKNGKVRWTDDGAVKIKTVPELHPFPFYLASYNSDGWQIDLLPSRTYGARWRTIVTPW
jgi:hypothetical protein